MAWFGQRRSEDLGVINSVIGEGAKIKGDIVTEGSIRISGELEGTIEAKGEIFVGEEGKIKGDVSGSRVVVGGEMNGNIVARNGLEITKTGRVYGDITGDRLVVDEGAVYKGRVNMEVTFQKEHQVRSESLFGA